MSAPRTVVVGCDPGLDGAFATMIDAELVDVQDMPTMSRRVAGTDRRYVAPDVLDGLLRSLMTSYIGPADTALFVLEQVGARPKEGAVGAFAFGRGVGHVEGLVIGLRLPRLTVTPVQWKRELKMRKGKDASRQRAMEMFPDHREEFARVKDDGRAEAALIALWAFTHHLKGSWL